MNRKQFAEIYLDWVNNFLTLQAFAEHYGLTVSEAEKLIEFASHCYYAPHPEA